MIKHKLELVMPENLHPEHVLAALEHGLLDYLLPTKDDKFCKYEMEYISEDKKLIGATFRVIPGTEHSV